MNADFEPQRNTGTKRGRRRIEDRECIRDCVMEMCRLRSCPRLLAQALREMGITENGDNVPVEE